MSSESNNLQPQKSAKPTDKQITGLAGEFFVAAELLKRGLQTSMTLGTAKQIDLLAYNPENKKAYPVQVKTLKAKNVFPLGYAKIEESHVYVFVLLNAIDENVEYFVVNGSALLRNEAEQFSSLKWDVRPGVRYQDLVPYKNRWDDVFTN
jgi:hypothetical protein